MGGAGGGMGGMGIGMRNPLPPPPEEAIEALVNMGFARDSAMRALMQGRNDLTVATHLLLGGGV